MTGQRRVLLGAGLIIALVGAFVLSQVLATVVVAVAASYMLVPVHRWVVGRGIPGYWSAIATTMLGVLVSLLLLIPFVFVLYLRRQAVIDVLTSLDGSYPIMVAGERYVLDLTPLQEAITPNISRLAVFLGRELSVLAAKFIVYAFVVFALLYYHNRLRSLVFGPVPPSYHGLIETVHRRIREVLFGHYVLVLIGGVTTYLAGLAVFVGLDYSVPYALALAGAVLWVLPFISAAPLVFALAVFHVLAGQTMMALSVTVLGGLFIVALPTFTVNLARARFDDPKRLSQTLYFVGFVGGGLTVGLVGFIAGPLALTILSTLFANLDQGGASESLSDETA
ncbi:MULTISPECIES: AI-2E family transporter [Salinibaculum]|uniref:AI-2E family transporter n=1 Tax=Salinibaculum TaxID=2732368 RepID=UPI0030CF54E4